MEKTFQVNYLNPCITPSVVSIQASTLPNKNYGNKYDIAESFSVSAFTVVGSGVTPASAINLCGELTYSAKFE